MTMTNKELIQQLKKPYTILSYTKNSDIGFDMIDIDISYNNTIMTISFSNKDFINDDIGYWYVLPDGQKNDYYFPPFDDYQDADYIDYFRQFEDIDAYLNNIA